MIDDRTVNLNLPKPHQANTLLEDVGRLRSALDAVDTAVAGKQSTLGFTPENAAKKGVANGYASLDAGGKVPSAQLPSYVDDVLEYANLAAFPATGESGKMYVAQDTGRLYRWSGSIYVWISPSPGSTDDVPEGSTNKYFTDARARSAQLPATASTPGVVKIGSGLSVDADGTLSAIGVEGGGGVPAFNELILTVSSNGQTVFTPAGGYTVGSMELELNGLTLVGNGDDYTASNGTTITLTFGVSTTDTLVLRRWTTTTNLPFSALVDKPTTLAGYGIATLDDPAITGSIKEDVYTITDGPAFEIDPGNGSVQLVTLGESRTPKATNFESGESVTLMVLDGSAYTLTWTDTTFGTSGVVWVGGVTPSLHTTKYTIIQLWKVGAQVYGISPGAA